MQPSTVGHLQLSILKGLIETSAFEFPPPQMNRYEGGESRR